MEIEKLGITGVALMDGERIEGSLNLGDGRGEARLSDTDAVLLTDRRIIHLAAKGGRRTAVFASLHDVDSVEITRDGIGWKGYGWGVLAFFVAVLLWQVWDHPVGSPLGALAVASMGVYLIIDHRLTTGRLRATFSAGSTTLECGVDGAEASQETYGFVNRLFHLKDLKGEAPPDRRGEPQEPPGPRVFAPR